MQQRFDQRFAIPNCQIPHFMLLDSRIAASWHSRDHESGRSPLRLAAYSFAFLLADLVELSTRLDFLELSLLRP